MEYSQTVRENVQSLAAMDKAGVDLTGSELEWTRFDVRGDFLWLYLFYRFGMAPGYAAYLFWQSFFLSFSFWRFSGKKIVWDF